MGDSGALEGQSVILVDGEILDRPNPNPPHDTSVLLRSNAVRANLINRVEYGSMRFQFEMIRVWEQPIGDFLNRGLGLLPLAVLARPPRGQSRSDVLPELVAQIADRVEAEAPELASDLLVSTYILAGMHLQRAVLQSIFHGVLAMRESVAIDVIMEEGAVAQTHELLLQMGHEKFGEPTEEQVRKFKSINHLPRLNRLAIRLLKVDNWDSLLRGR